MNGDDPQRDDEIARLRARVADLEAQSNRLADVVAHAAELMVELDESRERERALRQEEEELVVQNALAKLQGTTRSRDELLAGSASALTRLDFLGLGPAFAYRLHDGAPRAEGPADPAAACLGALGTIPTDVVALDAAVVVPLMAGSEPIGGIALSGQVSPEWCARWAHVFALIGSQIGAAIARIEDREALVRLNAELERRSDEARAANKAKSAFLANMSHELRTPLNAIIGYSEMLTDDARDSGNARLVDDLAKVLGAGRHLLALINDILDLSKIEAEKMEVHLEPADVQGIVREVVDLLRPRAIRTGVAVRFHVDVPRPVWIDVTKVRQILLNLGGNAIKFTHQGEVTLTAALRADGQPHLLLAVQDTGIGLSAEARERLFQPFVQADATTTRRYGGTGLGLAITRSFAQLLGGEITVASEPGAGSTFTVRLPVALADDGASEPPPADGRGLVLVIDDDPHARALLRRYLTHQGWTVSEAETGESGLAAARQYRPDAITLDVVLPDIDGLSVLRMLKSFAETADIPVVLVTMTDDRRTGFSFGATDFVPKPIDPERLARALRRVGTARRNARVLVVEDDPSSRDLAAAALHREGFVAVVAADVFEARRRVAGNLPDAVLLDLMLPGLDGFSFTEWLRAQPGGENVPVVVLSALDPGPDDRGRLRDLHVQDVVSKHRIGLPEALSRLDRALRLAPPKEVL